MNRYPFHDGLCIQSPGQCFLNYKNFTEPVGIFVLFLEAGLSMLVSATHRERIDISLNFGFI